jgi:stage II sporulation protein D
MRIFVGTVSFALLSFAAMLAAGASARAPQTARPPSGGATFVLTGRGWGHGVGFSQCGALGYGKHGWGYARILRHYYQGTQISIAPETRVRVLVADGRASLQLSSKTAFKVRDANGKTYPLPAATLTVTPALKVKVDPDKPARSLPGPLTFVPGSAPLTLDKPYRGQLVIRVTGGKLRAVNSLPLEQYLYAVVPIEIGSSGPAEALKAQAVAARSYALATRRTTGDFDLYPDVRSQSYGGANAEQPPTNAAVNATAGQVISYKGKVITAYYFASSGGRTASVQDVWGGNPVPYLVSVDDPYDGVCPQHSWGPYIYSAATLARKLGMAGGVLDARTVLNASKRVSTLQVRTATRKVALTGAAVRRTMGLRSTWFRVGVLSLTPPGKPAVYGTGIDLNGVARGVGPAHLERRLPGKQWAQAAGLDPAADGTFLERVKPKRTTDYRVVGAKAASGAVRVTIAPRVRLEVGAGGLAGTVRPGLAGVRVDVQRQAGSRWTTVASVRTTATGSFSATFDVAAGTYRARVGATQGLAAGVSLPLQVTA